MAAESRVGSLLGGGTASPCSTGRQQKALQPVYDLLENCDVPISKLLPTHVNRNVPLFEQALEFARKGSTIDITSSIDEPVACRRYCPRRSGGYSRWHASLSSDGNGSQPFFDDEGNLTHIGVAGFETLLETVQVLVKDYDFSISDACARSPVA